MKNNSFKHSSGNSSTTVAIEDMIPGSVLKFIKFRHDNTYSSYYNSYYGFLITESDLAKFQTFFCRCSQFCGKVEENEICFVNLDGIKVNWSETDVSMPEWTVCWVCRTLKSAMIPDGYVFLKFPRSGMYRVPFPASKVTMFPTKEEYLKHEEKLDNQRNKKYAKYVEQREATNNGPMNFETPRRTVTAINQKTSSFDVQIGDTIVGKIKVLDESGNSVMNVSSSYVNYVDVYVNDKLVNKGIPMSTFAGIMSFNFVLE